MSGQPRRWVVAVVAALALGGFEFGVARDPSIAQQVYTDSVAVLEREVVPGTAAPRLVVFGDSRTLYAVHEQRLAANLGLGRSAVAKLALNGGTVADSLYLYGRYRNRLSKADAVVIGIRTSQIALRPRCDPRVLRYARDSDLSDYAAPTWPQLVLYRNVHTCAVLRPLLRHRIRAALRAVRETVWKSHPQPTVRGARDGVFGERDPEIERAWTSGEWYEQSPAPTRTSSTGRLEQPGLRWDASVINDNLRASSEVSRTGLHQLVRLLDALQQDGAEVLVVHWPMTDEYFDDLEARYPEFARAYDEAMADLRAYAATHPNVEVRDYGRASQWGLDYRAFYDYGHPSPLGREFCTRELEEWAREHLDD